MQYTLYDMDLFDFIDLTVSKKLKKKMPELHDQFIFAMADCSVNIPSFYHDLLFNISCEDYKWAKSGKKIIFIGEKMAMDLISSKAVVSKADSSDFHITLPFSDFMISVPRGLTMPDGTAIPSFMATVATERESLEGMLDVINECKTKYKSSDQRKVRMDNENPRDVKRLSFRFKLGNAKGQTVTQVLEPEEIPALMAAETAAEFVEMRRGKSLAASRALSLEDEETAIGYYILKLIVSLSMYHEATDGKYLKEGLPEDSGSVGLKASMREKNNTNTNTLTAPISETGYTDRKSHVRGWHYRNLRAPRYYKGTHADKPMGSRWVMVASSLVSGRAGGKVEPYTQE